MVSREELACIYSAAILADDEVPVTADKISTILKAAGVSVENIWPNLFARALQGVNVRDLIANSAVSSQSAGGATQAQGPADTAAEKVKDTAADKPPPSDDSDSDDDMGFGLFD